LDKWLSERLSPARYSSAQWRALYEAVEEWAKQGLFPDIDRLKEARKTFTTDREALNLLIDDMGDFFEHEDLSSYEERLRQNHIDILWRRHELHNKRLTIAFESYVNRVMKLHGMTLTWEPLYWRRDQDYSNAQLYPKIGILDEHCELLSQRGSIYADITYISAESADWIVDKLEYAMDRARKILPEHIVVDSAIIHRRKDTHWFHHLTTLANAVMITYATNKGDLNVGYVDSETRLISLLGHTSNASNVAFYHNLGDTNTAHIENETKQIGLIGHTTNATAIAGSDNKGDHNTGHVKADDEELNRLRASIRQAYIAHAKGKTYR